MFRVANFAQHQLTMSYAMRTQSNWADRQIQIASGKQGQLYSSIATKASELVNVERSVGRTEQFSRNIDQALNRLGRIHSAVGTMVVGDTEVQSNIISAMSELGRGSLRESV